MEAPQFKNLSDLISYLRSNLNNVRPRDLLEQLHTLLGTEVTIRYELGPDTTVSSGQSVQSVQSVVQVPSGQKSGKDRSKYAHTDGKTISRILISTYRKGEKLSTELYRQLNGLVFQLPGWKLLSVSSPILSFNFKMSDVVNNFDCYDVYPVIDGTVVTLYWYEGIVNKPEVSVPVTSSQGVSSQVVSSQGLNTEKVSSWRLSSSNGYDVTNMRWLGKKTYMEALLELTGQYPTFSLDRLSKLCSYTIGFRHPEFQPMKYDGPKIWFIQSCNTSLVNSLSVANVDITKLIGNTGTNVGELLNKMMSRPVLMVNTSEDIGLPIQAPIKFPDGMTGEKVVEMLRKHNEDALVEFSKSLSGDFVVSPHYGYFLRPKIIREDLSDIMWESTLLHLVKNALYNFPKKRNVGESDLTPDNRMEYAKLRAYLSNTMKYPFITLFPQYQNDYIRFDALFNKIAERIIQIIRKPNDKKSNDPRCELIAQKFASHIKEKQVNVLNTEGLSIILDFLRDRRYLELYFNVLIMGV